MKVVQMQQGTPEWHAHRANHFNASDAPAMLGVSPYKTRAQLVREFATGITPDIDAATQRRFDDGHRFEALARPTAEQIIGEELFPCVGVSDCGTYSASFDGLTMLGDTAFEHKSLNDDLRSCVTDIHAGDRLPMLYRVQMEQQAMVSGAERVLFMASKWDSDDNLVEERHCWYVPDPELRAKVIAGWEQFAADVAAYTHVEKAEPVATGRAPDQLPSLRVEVTGMVTASNLAEFKSSALSVLGSINRDLQTDEDFANAEQTVKWAKGVEDRLAVTKDQVLSQTADIEAVFRTIDEVSAETRRVRLELDRLVKAEKENRKGEIVQKARVAYSEHEAALRAETKDVWITLPAPDFAGAIKGKKSLASMQDAVDTVMANAKITANESAKHIREALSCLAEETAEHKHLFPDFRDFIAKPIDDIRALVRGRIAEHKQREAEKLEAERERIRQEEADKLAKEAADKAAAEVEAQKREQAAEELAKAKASPDGADLSPEAQKLNEAEGAQRFAQAHPSVAATGQPAKRIKLGDVNAWIAPLSITADGLAQLGFRPVGTDRAAKLYNAADFPLICGAIARVVAEAPAIAAQKVAA